MAMGDKELLDALQAAEGDVRRVRGVLVDVQAGRGDVSDVVETLFEHWGEHRRTYGTVGALILDRLRLDLLAQLYGWRQQVSEQLQAQRRRQPPEPPGTSS